ncbi:MAG TPA: ATP-dependent RecD-like DNA helicase [Planctomycetota bacterium]|nr:ATP-dependent RecD-like DNA helicase [Planctomycetota bacterium]HRR80403.1 ATP-dependent RecD-like DNA helicase [Planctomycetota bacterium]HRT95382.1 ATP-dependent RecD-like DNA helicase [Planctomycetota bacterium]
MSLFKSPEGAESFQGTVERVVFSAPDRAYAVARVRPEGRGGLVTAVGKLLELKEGEVLRLEGRWVTHKTHGRQFEVEHYEVVAPTSARGIQRYLGSGLVPGIGPELAARLVKRFGEATLDVIEHQPERLREVEGIGRKRQQQIIEAYGAQKGLREVMVFLHEYGVSPAVGARIYKTYGSSAISIVRDNPYRLAADIFGVGFRTADRIAANLGIPHDSPQRAAAGVVHALRELGDDGHACYPQRTLAEAASRMLEVPVEQVEAAIEAQRVGGELVVDDAHPLRPVYLPALHAAETGVAQRLAELAATPAPFPPIDAGRAVEWVQRQVRIQLPPGQQDALRKAVASKLTVITGGPGVGKTTVLRCLVEIFQARRLRVALGAPTGRAAKRLAEVTRTDAMTIHRLLKYQPRTSAFEYNERNPLQADVVIVDEASMLDLLLTCHLARALSPQTVLVLVGDVDQLPSVGPGSVLRDVIASGVAAVARLTDIFRQEAHSLIVGNAHRINRGEMPALNGPGEGPARDFFFLERADPEEAAETVLDLVARRLPAAYGLDPVDDIQVLAPMHRGAVGAQALNERLRERLNPAETPGGRGFRPGDKVMQIRNNYDKEVFNGDLGRVLEARPDAGQVIVRLDERELAYGPDELDELVPAYAITIHKSQGCEYPAVVVPILTQHYMMLQRNLLYTAVTRGRRLVVLVGTKRAIAIAVRNDRIRERHSLLRERLANARPHEPFPPED